MNIHLAQSVQARNEIDKIANVKYNIISAKDSNPIIGCVQDTLVGAYVLTTTDDMIDYHTACNILCSTTSKSKYNLKKGVALNGHQFFSNIIPKGINDIKDNFQIKEGNLLKGILSKKTLSTVNNSIIHFIWDKYGPDKTSNFIDDSQKLILEYLMYQGLTIGFKDCIIEKSVTKKLFDIAKQKILEVKNYITKMENDINNTAVDLIENSITGELTTVGANIGRNLEDYLTNANNFFKCVKSGAKGNIGNIYQIMGVWGQITIMGSRIKKNVEQRTLPCFHKNDDTAEARGFVYNNYVTGLDGHEFFFHTASGREGLIDTAIKTAQTGYIQRRLIKAMEDLSVRYDGTVRTANNIIVQYIYGENGINQLTQTKIKLNLITYNNKEVKENLTFDDKQVKELTKNLKNKTIETFNKKFYNNMLEFRNSLRDIQRIANLNYRVVEENYKIPVNLNRLTSDFMKEKILKFDLEPQYILDKIDSVIKNLDNKLIVYTKEDSKLFKNDEIEFKYIFKIALYEYLAPVKCIYKYKLDKKSFDELISEIENSYIKSIVEPGEMVGVIAAQSVGEPTSQMNLDSKHAAGKGGSGTAALSGVPRITELLGYSKNIKTPQMTVYFDRELQENKQSVNRINSFFKHLTIMELIDSAEIYYQVKTDNTFDKLLEEDNTVNPFFINNQKVDLENMPFIYRLKMNLEKMMDKETTILDLKTKFMSYWYNTTQNPKSMKKVEKEIFSRINKMAILGSSDSNSDQIIHIRFSMSNFDYNILNEFMKLILNGIQLKGINNISNTVLEQQRNVLFDKDGNEEIIKENVIITSGINMDDLKKFKGIDLKRSICNDVGVTYRLYGVEAARNLLMYELRTTFGGGGGINYNHLSLLVDFMTHTGEITSIDRHGLGKLDIDPLSKASFEKTMEHFINAAVFNESDKLNSVSSRIMVGQVIPGGTGAFNIELDTNKLINSEYITDEAGGRSDFVDLEPIPILEDIMKFGINETNFFIPTEVY